MFISSRTEDYYDALNQAWDDEDRDSIHSLYDADDQLRTTSSQSSNVIDAVAMDDEISIDDIWPPLGLPADTAENALAFNPAFVQEFKGLKIHRPNICCKTLQISEFFHGRRRRDSVILNSVDDDD